MTVINFREVTIMTTQARQETFAGEFMIEVDAGTARDFVDWREGVIEYDDVLDSMNDIMAEIKQLPQVAAWLNKVERIQAFVINECTLEGYPALG